MSESKEREGAEGGVEGGEMAGGAEAAEEELPEAHVQEEEMVGVAVQQEGDKLPPSRDDVVEEASPSDEGNSPISPHENADVELAPPTGGDGEVVEVMSGNAVEVKGEVGEKVNVESGGGDVEKDDASGGPSKEKAIGELEHGGSSKEHHQSQEAAKPTFDFNTHSEDGSESGSEEEQAAFMKELANFFRERGLDFKPPKFYGEGLNCLKLWRAVIRLGGYDQVTYCKLWRQVGESFKPPKTCTTVSWTFRGFYEKALLDYERHKVRNGEFKPSIQLPKTTTTQIHETHLSFLFLAAMSTGELLNIYPTELKFPFELKKQSSCSLQLTNKSDQYVAFKVKTTNPKKYCVRPNTGIVMPGATCEVTVTMQAPKEAPLDMQCKDKFLLQSVAASDVATTKDITPEMFNKEVGKVVEEFKLRVAYIPANPPSPVPEESEEVSSPRGSEMYNGTNSSSLFDAVSRSAEDPIERTSEAWSMISKLSQEKTNAIQQNQRLQQELELMRKEVSRRKVAGFSVMFVVMAGLVGAVLGYLVKVT